MMCQPKWWSLIFLILSASLLSSSSAYRGDGSKKDDSFEKLKKLLSADELKTLVHVLETDIDIDADSYGVDKYDLWGVEKKDISDKDDYELLEALESLNDDYDDYDYDADGYGDEYDGYGDEYDGYGDEYDDDYDYDDSLDDLDAYDYGHDVDEDYALNKRPHYRRKGRKHSGKNIYGKRGRHGRHHHHSGDKTGGRDYDLESSKDSSGKMFKVDLSKNGLGIKRKMGYQKLSSIPELNLQDLGKFKEIEKKYFPNGHSKSKSKNSNRKRGSYFNPLLMSSKISGGYFGKPAGSSKDSTDIKIYKIFKSGKETDSSKDSGHERSDDYDSKSNLETSKTAATKSDNYSPKSSSSKDSHESGDYNAKSLSVKRSDDYRAKSSMLPSHKAHDDKEATKSDNEHKHSNNHDHNHNHDHDYDHGEEMRRRRRRRNDRQHRRRKYHHRRHHGRHSRHPRRENDNDEGYGRQSEKHHDSHDKKSKK